MATPLNHPEPIGNFRQAVAAGPAVGGYAQPPAWLGIPGAPKSPVLREYPSYVEAQALVDRLSDSGFPVQHVRIIGTDMHSVEQVTGRLTNARGALHGAGGGAWFGLMIGLLLSVFTVGTGLLVTLLVSLAIGAFWGALFGLVAHWSTRGRRDFSSVRGLVAEHYTVEVDIDYFDEAAELVTAPAASYAG